VIEDERGGPVVVAVGGGGTASHGTTKGGTRGILSASKIGTKPMILSRSLSL